MDTCTCKCERDENRFLEADQFSCYMYGDGQGGGHATACSCECGKCVEEKHEFYDDCDCEQCEWAVTDGVNGDKGLSLCRWDEVDGIRNARRDIL